MIVPAGVLALTGDAVRRQRAAEQRCLDVLLAEGFSQVLLPVLEYEGEQVGNGYRFVDRSGQVVVLRTDFTPLAARVLGHRIENGVLPLAICYAGEVVRPRQHVLRELPELYQLGFERYGVEHGASESLELSLRLLREIGIAPARCHVTVSVAGLAERILARLLGAPASEEVVELLRVRDLDCLRDELALDRSLFDLLESALFDGGVDRWPDGLGVRKEVEAAMPALAVAAAAGVAASLEVAPRLAAGYYRGVVFSVWGAGTRAVLAGGGDYEAPLRRTTVPATGACLSLGICLEEAALQQAYGAGDNAAAAGESAQGQGGTRRRGGAAPRTSKAPAGGRRDRATLDARRSTGRVGGRC